MSRSTLEWYEQMARGLVWAAGIVLLLAAIGAIIIAGSDDAIGIAPEAERQGRGVFALASLGGGLAAAGLLAGLGAILRLLVTDRLERLEPAPQPGAREGRRAAPGGGSAERRGGARGPVAESWGAGEDPDAERR